MKTVMMEYGKTVLAVGIAVLILGILLGGVPGISESGGIWSLIQNQAKEHEPEKSAIMDDELYQKVWNRDAPVIFYQGENVRAGEKLDLSKLFGAEDCEGKQLTIQILQVNGRDVDGKMYEFPVSGIYEIEVYAKDDYGLMTHSIFRIPVQHLAVGKGKDG